MIRALKNFPSLLFPKISNFETPSHSHTRTQTQNTQTHRTERERERERRCFLPLMLGENQNPTSDLYVKFGVFVCLFFADS